MEVGWKSKDEYVYCLMKFSDLNFCCLSQSEVQCRYNSKLLAPSCIPDMFIAVVAFRLILTVSQLSMIAKQKKTKTIQRKVSIDCTFLNDKIKAKHS